ncbi:MAG: hypothetical protein K9N23_21015 [Akkermansiaceae bacterium]|nr:hypothetical protein [Akkermansiaceae bacterium]MCF7734178.1 hypothetical protein [Akkermansiaceae bacterium]
MLLTDRQNDTNPRVNIGSVVHGWKGNTFSAGCIILVGASRSGIFLMNPAVQA